jgi:hypothetical protein
MNNKMFKRKKALALFIVLIFSFSLVVNTRNNLAIQTNFSSDTTITTESLTVDKIPLPKIQVTQYVDETIVANIADSPENVTSPGTFDNSLIIGEADGLKMTFSHTVDSVEYALLKLDGAITTDSLTLRNVDDLGGLDSLLFVFGWSDPYIAPTVDSVNHTYIDEKFTLLGTDLGIGGDLVLTYDNISLEYLLLFEDSSVPQPTSIDAVEVNGFTSFIADEGKNGIPDIWEYPDMNLTQIVEDIDLFGTTYEIMSLVGTAYPGSTNLDFLIPFVKLGLIDEEEIDETHFYIICQTELKLPYSSTYDYLQFLHSYDLVNMTYIEGNITIENEVYAAFDKYIGQDQRIRTWQFIDYTVDGEYDPINYEATGNQIKGKYATLDTTTQKTETAQEKFDLDVSIVLDIVENVLDAVIGGKDLVEQFMSKIVGFIQGKVMDGVGKKLLEKLAKKALKSAIKCIFSITTVKDIVVKGIMILGKLGVPIPSWLQKVLDFVTSIPFIDPPVEIRKMRLTFMNEYTGSPILGWDFNTDTPIYTHPKGIYFGDTYSAQVILSSRDIFPVIGRIQSKNATRVVTGHLYVEDFILEEATHAKSSLEPDESAQGRIYTIPPDGSIVISQCLVTYSGVTSSVVEADVGFKLYFTVTDENGTSLTDISKTKAAINDLPDPMILLPVTLEPDSRFSVDVNPALLGIDLDYHMVAFLYKTNTIFHDYCNYTFMLQDTIAPVIQNVTAIIDEVQNRIYFSAKISDYDLNISSVFVTLIMDSTDEALGTSYIMSNNGTHYVFDIPTDDFSKSTLYYKVKASDNSGNNAASTLESITVPKKANGFSIVTSMLSVLLVSTLLISRRRNKIKK